MKRDVFVGYSKVVGESIGGLKKYIFTGVLFFMFSSFLLNAQNVTLGPDIAVCEGDPVILSDLNPVVLSPTGNEWWKSSGDGIFTLSDGVTHEDNYGLAIRYNPGSVDISNGKVVISLYSGATLEASVTVYIENDILFACNDQVTVPLNFHCEYQITPPMLLEGEDENLPYNLYDVELRDASDNLIPGNLITGEYIDQTISFYISHSCSYNACGGFISVQDNYRPIMDCGNDTITCKIPLDPNYSLGFPIDLVQFPSVDIIEDPESDNHYIVKNWDQCGAVRLSYTDEIESFDCAQDLIFQSKIVRSWEAIDASGNKSKCSDNIWIKRIKAKDAKMPPDWNNIDTVALQCDGDWLDSALPDGYPSPEKTGFPEVWGCNIEYSYKDQPFGGCGNTFDIIRKWTVVDWCNSDSIVTYNQVIKIMDTLPPQISCDNDTTVINSEPYDCFSGNYKLQLPQVEDNCNSFQFFVKVYDENNTEIPVQKSGEDYYVDNLPLGVYAVNVKAVDDCGNVGECTNYLKVVDEQTPYAVCGEHHVVNLTSNGEARLYPASIDDGSFDNCGIDTMQIKKMTSSCDNSYAEFGEYVGFCCEEVNTTVMVVLKVVDFFGNYNSCMVEVTVKDKLPPQIVCPPNLHVSCNYYFNTDDLNSYFGTVREDQSLVEDIVIEDYFNSGVVGQDGYAYDNCNVGVTEEDDFQIADCNVGTITRTFTASDNGGRTNICQQVIEITNPTPFTGDDIIWPENSTFYGCSNLDADTSVTGVPVFNDDICSMVATSYSDQLFSVEGDACKKVIRTWTIRDWCQSDDIKWEHKQHIMLFNEEAPVFTSDCQDREVCVYGECRGQVDLTATAEDDCTPASDLEWSWKLDENNDGTYDDFGYSNNFSKIMEEGQNKIVWTVEDKCGNISSCSYVFTVRDCKKPTPLCIESLSTAVMNTSGIVAVKAKDFNRFSFDNCTNSNYGDCGCKTDLRFSFSENVNDTLYYITCDSLYNGIERVFDLKMWVTDNANNQDYCSIKLKVSDNDDVCEDSGVNEEVKVSGLFTKWSDNSPVPDINVEISSPNTEDLEYDDSDNNGAFEFDGLSQGNDYSVIPQDDKSNCLDGISTLDIVKIQKHILGIKKFKSPYQFIAADVNENNKITAADILYVRKMILGVTNNYKNKSCWEYVDSKQQLTIHDPYSFDSRITINNINTDVDDVNFKVVKIGDINDSHSLDKLLGGVAYRNDTKFKLVVDDMAFSKGENFEIPVYPELDGDIEGVQFTIVFNLDNMSYEGFSAGQLDVNDSNFGLFNLDKGILTFSWNTVGGKSLSKDNPLFSLKFTANGKSSVLQDFAINSDITKALSIVEDKEVGIKLNYRSDNAPEELVVYQNTPNPFKDNTFIRFALPQAQDVLIEVFDINSNLLLAESRYFEKGLNSFEVSKSKLGSSGVYYYSVKISERTITKKMILIN